MLYSFVSFLIRLFLNHRVNIHGKENVPQDGPAILICNHRCAFDPIALATITKRKVSYLAKKELFENKLSDWFLKQFYAIPIDREGTDRTALRNAIKVLKNGDILGIFPEGTRSHDGNLLPFKSGSSFIASQSQVGFLPCAIDHSDSIFNPFAPKVNIWVGPYIPYQALPGEKKRETMERMTTVQEDAVGRLLQQGESQWK